MHPQGETKTMKILLSKRPMWAMVIAASLSAATGVSAADKKYDFGASDTEIKLGQTVPHSGPGSLYGVIGRVGEAYFQMLNEKGGINGRKIKFFSMDDAYSSPKAVEATRRLVEQKYWLCSVRWAPHRRPRFTNTSIQRACRSFS
jgi:ABC-type branched-subunit amino acid transport system substrate-binding protein